MTPDCFAPLFSNDDLNDIFVTRPLLLRCTPIS